MQTMNPIQMKRLNGGICGDLVARAKVNGEWRNVIIGHVSFVSLNVLTWNYTGSFWESAEGLRDVNEETREYVNANAYLNAAQHFAGDLLSEIGGVFPVVGYNNGKSIEEIAAPSLPFQKLDNIDNTMFADLREIHEKEGVADIAGNMMRRYMALEIWEFLCNPVIWMSVAWMAHSMNRKTHVTYFEIDEILLRNMAIYEESVQPFKGPFQLEGLYEMNENSDEH